MDENETRWSQYFDVSNDSLRSYFGSVAKGRSKVLYGAWMNVDSEEKVQSVLRDWSKHLDSLATDWPTLYDFELEMRSKVGPMSIMLPLSKRQDDIKAYYDCVQGASNFKPIMTEAINKVINEFKPIKGIRLRSQSETLNQMRKSTSSGSPYFDTRRDVMDVTFPVLNVDSTKYSYTLGKRNSRWNYCAMLGWRGQEGGPSEDDTKQRVVWMFPFGINIRELQMYQPLTEGCQKTGLIAPWISMEAVDHRITSLFDTKDPNDLVVCTDFSKFDQHFNKVMQQAAYDIYLKLLSSEPPSYEWLENIFPIKFNIPLATKWESILYGMHGMASGSGGTNADETMSHRALQYESAISNHAALNLNSMCLGDDGILSYPGIDTNKVLKTYTAHGLEMNDSKQYASTDDCVFLRRWHHKDYRLNGECVGVYSTCRALGRLMYKERYHRDWSYIDETLRSLSILENCKNHPLRDEFANYVMERDRYHLGKDIPNFLARIDEIAKERADTIHAELSYTNTMKATQGLASWWIVNYVKQH